MDKEKTGLLKKMVCRLFHSKHHKLVMIYGKYLCEFKCEKCGTVFTGNCGW